MKPLPRALLLDLDDTILSYGSASQPAWRRVCEAHAASIDGVAAQRLFEAIREASDLFWSDPERHRTGRLDMVEARRRIVRSAFHSLNIEAPELARRVADEFTLLREQLVRVFPGAMEVLRTFRERGLRLALVTNGASHMQRAKIERFDLGPLFDAILVEGEWGAGKPDPSIFHEGLRRLGDVTTEEAWMVGDSLEFDIAGAQAVGLRAVWNDHSRRGLPESTSVYPDRIISHLRELL